MIVVDTNILVHLCLRNEQVQAVGKLLQDEPKWCAPALWRSELRNVLIGYVRRGELPIDRAIALQLEMEEMLSDSEHQPDSHTVLTLASESGCTPYDCEFVAVALALGIKLVTRDKKVLKAFPAIAIPLAA